jgi:drug/metabolite transporter (DMT)-like permease
VHRGSLAWVAAIGSLYPASTLVLARVVLKERVWPPQLAGLTLAGGALVLVGIGR